MAQYHELNNHYQINNIAGWPALFARLQESSGQPIVDIAHSYEYDVSGLGKPDHVYELRIQSSTLDDHKTHYLIVNLGGKPLINDPMHNLRSAEELVDTMMTLRAHNKGKLPSLMSTGAPYATVMNEAVQRHALETGLDGTGIAHFFQQYDPLSWLEAAASLREFGDIEAGDTLTIKTSREGIETGVYTLQKVTRDDKVGVEVLQDGHPFWNYGKPQTSTAEQVVSLILKLKEGFGSIPLGGEFHFDADHPKPLVASMKDGQTEIKLFVNGTITITGPGVMNMVAMSAEDTDRANALMEKILDLTPKQ
jgi:ribosomal protein L31